MNFKKFSSIDNHYRQKTVNCITETDIGLGEWVLLLKIHGSNYSYFCNGTKVKRGKRTSFLGGNETFYGDQHFDYSENIKSMYLLLKQICDIKHLAVYGEVYGGVYPHPDVPKVQGYTKVQKEVYYCIENRFICYDIEVNGEPLSWDNVVGLCNEFDIPLVPELKRGSFEDLIKEPTEFIDPLYKEYNLPPIEGNIAEGWVLKPVKEKTFSNGSRVILKGKAPKFLEKNRLKKTPKIVKLSDEGNEVRDILNSFITENRLRNVYSHGHDFGQKDFGKIMGLLIQDAFNDFIKEYKERFEVLDLDEQKLIKKIAGKQAGEVIRPHFVNIIDKVF